MEIQSEHMKNGDQKPETYEDPPGSSPALPGGLGLQQLADANSHKDERPIMGNRPKVYQIEIIEQKCNSEKNKNDSRDKCACETSFRGLIHG